jgi:hypothetical protein
MILTFRHLYEQVAAQHDERTNTGTTRDLVKEYLNQAHSLRCTEYAQHFLVWDREETITTVADQQVYALHQLFDRPLYFINRTARNWLVEVPNRTLTPNEYEVTSTQQGPARNFTFWGFESVKAQPATPSVITLVSDSALDDGASYQVGVKGINTDGELVVDVVTMDGTTPVSTAVTFDRVLAVTKGAAFNGTLEATAGAVEILRLSPTEFGRQYRLIHLLETPTTAETLAYRFYRKPLYLTRDYDIPEIPAPYSQLLVYDALLLMAAYNTDPSEKSIAIWREAQRRWEKALAAHCAESQTLQSRSQYVQESTEYSRTGMDFS